MYTLYVAYELETNEIASEGSLEELEEYATDEYNICTKECYERGENILS